MPTKKEKSQISWLQILIIFLLGILIASNVFMFIQLNDLKADLIQKNEEINKLKADDVAIAQAINNLYVQLQSLGIIKPPAETNQKN